MILLFCGRFRQHPHPPPHPHTPTPHTPTPPHPHTHTPPHPHTPTPTHPHSHTPTHPHTHTPTHTHTHAQTHTHTYTLNTNALLSPTVAATPPTSVPHLWAGYSPALHRGRPHHRRRPVWVYGGPGLRQWYRLYYFAGLVSHGIGLRFGGLDSLHVPCCAFNCGNKRQIPYIRHLMGNPKGPLSGTVGCKSCCQDSGVTTAIRPDHTLHLEQSFMLPLDLEYLPTIGTRRTSV